MSVQGSAIICVCLLITSIFLVVSSFVSDRLEEKKKKQKEDDFRKGYEELQAGGAEQNYKICVNGVQVSHFPLYDKVDVVNYVVDDANQIIFIQIK